MMIGVDYPHHEGMWNGGTQNYLQATLGANRGARSTRPAGWSAGTPSACSASTRRCCAPIADRIGPEPEVVLTPPAEDLFPRGDVHKPLGGANIG